MSHSSVRLVPPPTVGPHDPHASCPKCKHQRISTKHVSFGYLGMGEAIRRFCERCGFAWDEDVA